MTSFDLLSTVEYGGCSAKLAAGELSSALMGLPKMVHPNLLVDIETHDDAGVFKISDEVALIQTTDFFPPLCSDAYEFGQIAAANALSDVYAMGGEVITALNIVAFPAKVSLEILKEILRGGIDKVTEAGGVIVGGHTIVDDVPKYGLAVTGIVHPERIISNAAALPGDVLILTKPVGGGTVLAGKKINEAAEEDYLKVMQSMKQLNKAGAEIMQEYQIKSATDITGFGLAGHALKMAMASQVTLRINARNVPVFGGALRLLQIGCIPGACFRNLDYVEQDSVIATGLPYEFKMLMMDAQTSGGLLISCPEAKATSVLSAFKNSGFQNATLIGNVISKQEKFLMFE